MECKHCNSTQLRRMPREGFLQSKIFPKFHYYPWECMHCRTITMLKARAKRRSSQPIGSHPLNVPTQGMMQHQQS